MKTFKISIVYFPLLILFLNHNSFSQMDEFTDLIGDWRAEYKNNINVFLEENLTIKFTHFNKWLQFEIVGGPTSREDQNTDLKFSSIEVLTLDDKFNLIGYYISNGGYRSMLKIKGVIEDGKIIIELKSEFYSDKTSWFLKDGNLHRKGSTKLKDTDEIFENEVIFTRKTK